MSANLSIPPQLIRVKRKRVEEAPVTFLQFDERSKRHRSGSNWVYQRRDSRAQGPARPQDATPVIHVSQPDQQPPQNAVPPSKRKTLEPKSSLQRLRAEPRRFHLSRSMKEKTAENQALIPAGISKKARTGPAVFVERSRKKIAQKTLQAQRSLQNLAPSQKTIVEDHVRLQTEPERVFKKPGTRTPRAISPHPGAPSRAPLPQITPDSQQMGRIAADMNQWVLNEIGANLAEMELEKKQASKFKPKAPAKRFQERHPEQAVSLQADGAMDTDMSEDDGSDGEWVIEEYVRIPAHSMAVDVSPTEVGVLVLEGEEDDILFFGPEQDEDDDYDEVDEDENAENHYTADYPEDEVESDDEYGRQAYCYRNASDDEEFDNELFEDNDEDEMVMEGDDDDVTMARIKAYMRRNKGLQ